MSRPDCDPGPTILPMVHVEGSRPPNGKAFGFAAAVKDSGKRQEFDSGMVRDTQEGKVDYINIRFGPMFDRWATHLTAGRVKYPDVAPGVPNWTLAAGVPEYIRARESAARHFEQWLRGDTDEDHAAACFFNINLAEYIKARAHQQAAATVESEVQP